MISFDASEIDHWSDKPDSHDEIRATLDPVWVVLAEALSEALLDAAERGFATSSISFKELLLRKAMHFSGMIRTAAFCGG